MRLAWHRLIHRVCCWLGFHECNYYGFCIHCGWPHHPYKR